MPAEFRDRHVGVGQLDLGVDPSVAVVAFGIAQHAVELAAEQIGTDIDFRFEAFANRGDRRIGEAEVDAPSKRRDRIEVFAPCQESLNPADVE